MKIGLIDVDGHNYPNVMIYDKEHKDRNHYTRKLQRWCNERRLFWSIDRFEDYDMRR